MKIKFMSTTFAKMTFAFVVFGLLPLILLDIFFIRRYSDILQKVVVSDYSEINRYFAKNVSNMLSEVDYALEGIYEYETDAGESLAEVLKDERVASSDRQYFINSALFGILSKSNNISSVRFADREGNTYGIYVDQDKVLRAEDWHTSMEVFGPGMNLCDMVVLGAVSEEELCINSDDYIFTIVRNYMDVTSLEMTSTFAMGTVFADVNVETIGSIIRGMDMADSDGYIYDFENERYVYSIDGSAYVDGADPLGEVKDLIADREGNINLGGYWYFYQRIDDTRLYSVLRIERTKINGSFYQATGIMILILGFAGAFLFIAYLAFTVRLSEPARKLKEAMATVEEGRLDVHVNLSTNDEMEYIADGFNKMVDRLQDYIDQVYVAQICQKEAELNALKMQIRPHYLYNTLDVIRMKAIDNGDDQTAELLECLAHQLRYVMGEHSDTVTLGEELESLREYFVIAKARYEKRIAFNVNVRDEDLELRILKFMLQPVVENSVKHGLKSKNGAGAVAVNIERMEDRLEIVVMDDGVGIEPEKLEKMQELLELEDVRTADYEGIMGVGVKNVHDRIRLDCGKQYGLTIHSVVGAGTIVTFCLPIWEADLEEEQ